MARLVRMLQALVAVLVMGGWCMGFAPPCVAEVGLAAETRSPLGPHQTPEPPLPEPAKQETSEESELPTPEAMKLAKATANARRRANTDAHATSVHEQRKSLPQARRAPSARPLHDSDLPPAQPAHLAYQRILI